MTDDQREGIIDLALVTLGAVAAYYVWRTPPLRRVAWQLLKYGVIAAPAMVWQETTRAWAETAHN